MVDINLINAFIKNVAHRRGKQVTTYRVTPGKAMPTILSSSTFNKERLKTMRENSRGKQLLAELVKNIVFHVWKLSHHLIQDIEHLQSKWIDILFLL